MDMISLSNSAPASDSLCTALSINIVSTRTGNHTLIVRRGYLPRTARHCQAPDTQLLHRFDAVVARQRCRELEQQIGRHRTRSIPAANEKVDDRCGHAVTP